MEMFSYEFMRKAFFAATCISVIAPMLGVFLVIRRQSLLADTLSHVSLAGIALGLLLNMNPTVVTLFVVVIAALLLEYLRSVYHTYSELGTAILMSGGLAIALVLMDRGPGSSTSIQQYLFGSIVTINWDQVKILVCLLLLIIAAFILLKRPMYMLTFDEDTARVDGLPTRLMSLLFNVLTGVAIAVMIPIAGALLVSAIMVLPAAIGMRIGKSFTTVIIASTIVGLFGMLSGLYGSFVLDTPPAATITLIFITLLVVLSLVNMVSTKIVRKTSKTTK